VEKPLYPGSGPERGTQSFSPFRTALPLVPCLSPRRHHRAAPGTSRARAGQCGHFRPPHMLAERVHKKTDLVSKDPSSGPRLEKEQEMIIRNAQLNSRPPVREPGAAPRFPRLAGILGLAATVILAAAELPAFARQAAAPPAAQAPPNQSVECVLGLQKIKHHAKGTLTVQGDNLEFATDKGKADVSIASILDIFTNRDSRQVFRGLKGAAVKAAVPYEGGRVLSLFSRETEVLTVEYKDADGGYHGAVFVLPKDQATVIKKQLVAQGAHASIPPEEPGTTEEKKP
jgi:hypothetical protein